MVSARQSQVVEPDSPDIVFDADNLFFDENMALKDDLRNNGLIATSIPSQCDELSMAQKKPMFNSNAGLDFYHRKQDTSYNFDEDPDEFFEGSKDNKFKFNS